MPGATDYHVDRGYEPGGPYTLAGVVPSSVNTGSYSYLDAGLTAGKTYYYVVTAANTTDGTKSPNSTEVAAVPLPPAPAAPANVKATAGVEEVIVSWNASTGATAYHLDRGYVSGGPYTLVATVASAGATAYSYKDGNLTAGKTYYYVVTALDGSSKSANSTEVSAVPLPPAPAALTNVKATAGAAEVTTTWTGVSGATAYRVDRGYASGGPYTTVATVTATSSTSYTYTDTGLTSGKAYFYVITALDAADGTKSANSAQVSAAPS